MPDLYPIIQVKQESARDPEDMGSKDKFWYRHPQKEEDWLFKYPRLNKGEHTGEHWAEKIAAEVAALLEIQHARVELAVFEQKRGSVTKSFAQDGKELIHGNQMLARVFHNYDLKRKFHQSSHTLANIWQVMDHIFSKPEDAEKAKLCLAEYVLLDGLIGNTDRHHENWGILRKKKDDHWEEFVAPSFDHASSLGRELQDTRRDRRLAEDRIGDYVEKKGKKGSGAIYWLEDDQHGPSPLELVRRATCKYPDLFRPALTKLEKVDDRSLDNLVNRVPSDWMSPSAKKFAIALMRYNLEQLQELTQ